MIAFHFDPHILPLPPGHRFPIGKYGLLRRRVEADPRGIELRIGEPATEGELALAHDPGYIADVLAGTFSAARQREIGFEWTPALAKLKAELGIANTYLLHSCEAFLPAIEA